MSQRSMAPFEFNVVRSAVAVGSNLGLVLGSTNVDKTILTERLRLWGSTLKLSPQVGNLIAKGCDFVASAPSREPRTESNRAAEQGLCG